MSVQYKKIFDHVSFHLIDTDRLSGWDSIIASHIGGGSATERVVTAVLENAVDAEFLRQVEPHEVGSAKDRVAVFTPEQGTCME